MRFCTILITLIFCTLYITSCLPTNAPTLETEIKYQKDLTMKIRRWNGEGWSSEQLVRGMGVIPNAKGYKIRVEPPGKADLITLLSCHREWKTPNPERRGGWFSQKYYEFEIWPTPEHEVEKACSFEGGVFEKEKGRHAWGLLVIDSKRTTLRASVMCNGGTTIFNGTSVCQAKKGLIESIHFDRAVRVTQIKGCHIDVPDDNKNWYYQMPAGECTFFFVDLRNSRVFHKAVTFGYDAIPIRGVQ